MFDDDDFPDPVERLEFPGDGAPPLPAPAAPQPAQGPVVVWKELAPAAYDAELAELTEWVAWWVDRYELGAKIIPACWASHGPLVEELAALRSAWSLSFQPGDEGAGPLGWHERQALLLGRIEQRWYRHQCGEGHAPYRHRNLNQKGESS